MVDGNRLTLNLGGRWDKYVGTLPEQSTPGGTLLRRAHGPGKEAINQSIAVWRAGASYDLTGNGRTALKASDSRYGLQVGIDRVTNVNPLTRSAARDCPWTDPNGNRQLRRRRNQPGGLPGVQRRHVRRTTRDGVKWPYSDEVTAGIETQLPGAVRVGAMFYYRTNRKQIGQVNTLQPASAYTAHTVTIPNGPGGTVANPKPTDRRRSTTSAPRRTPLNASIRDNVDYLDTEYKGVEFTATKRFSKKWQMQTGFTLGKNEGGVQPPGAAGTRPERSEQHPLPDGHHRQRLRAGRSVCRAATSCRTASTSSGSMVANNGYPYVSTYSLTRAAAATQGITLTRASQTIQLSERGDERYDNVVMIDMRLGKSFRFGRGSFTPQIDFFNISNADTVVNTTTAVGPSYLLPAGGDPILSPRIIRVGFALNF